MKDKFLALPLPLKVVVAVLGLETLGLLALAVMLVIAALQSGQMTVFSSYAFGFFYLLVAASLALCAYGVALGKRQGRSLTLVWQLFAVIIGIQLWSAGSSLAPLAVLLGGLVLVCLFMSSALNHFE